MDRHERLGVPDNYPLAVYKRNANSKSYSFFVARGVQEILQLAGWKVYYPDVPKKDADVRFTCHSIRIGACALLYSQNASKDTIQSRLRWLSDNWKRYICHIPAVAAIQKKAVYHADTDSYKIPLLSVGYNDSAASA